jgi:hypothetical protein
MNLPRRRVTVSRVRKVRKEEDAQEDGKESEGRGASGAHEYATMPILGSGRMEEKSWSSRITLSSGSCQVGKGQYRCTISE